MIPYSHKRLLLFDLGGTLRCFRDPSQVAPRAPDDWVLMPNVCETLAQYDWDKTRAGIITNQEHIASGRTTQQVVCASINAVIDAAWPAHARYKTVNVAFCPHALDAGCPCRKPSPYLLLYMVSLLRLDRTIQPMLRVDDVLFVGNELCDFDAAQRAGIAFAWDFAFFQRPRACSPSEEVL